MITPKQRSRLMDSYRDEPLCVAGTLLKCAAGLVVIGGVTLVGSTRESTDVAAAQAEHSLRYSVAAGTPSHRQHVKPIDDSRHIRKQDSVEFSRPMSASSLAYPLKQ
jgi:hypothetical protein